jgi:hypothetical protein
MYNPVEVSGHNLESSQTRGFCMDFLKPWFSIRFFFRNCKRLREFEEIDVTSICKALESTVNNKEESF